MEQTAVSEAGAARPVQPFVRAELGDARTIMATLPADSVDCCITSPPYWGLRDYGLEPLSWGGSPDCAHRWEADSCAPCGAWRGSLGLEPTVDLFVAHIVEVFRAVRRVLKPTGTVWLNLGDCYNSGTTAPRAPSPSMAHHGYWRSGGAMGDRRVRAAGLKVKDLVGVPWRVALALQADGWYLRSDIIWAKPNPLPEGVTDRPTRAHEYLFLLSKSRRYFYDAQAIREPAAGSASDKQSDTRARRSVWTIATRPYRQAHFATYPERLVQLCLLAGLCRRLLRWLRRTLGSRVPSYLPEPWPSLQQRSPLPLPPAREPGLPSQARARLQHHPLAADLRLRAGAPTGHRARSLCRLRHDFGGGASLRPFRDRD